MQRQLTQEEAERCARAKGWEKDELCLTRPTDYMDTPTTCVWIDDEGEYHQGPDKETYPELSLDPHFWRPRLEDRLVEVAKEKGITKLYFQLTPDYGEGSSIAMFKIFYDNKTKPIGSAVEPLDVPIEIAYCEAIEKLTEAAAGGGEVKSSGN